MTQELFDKLTGPDEKGIIVNEFKNDYKEEYWQEYLEYYRENSSKYIKLFPGNLELLQNLKKKGYHLVFLTGRSKETGTISLKDFGVYDLFEKLYFGSRKECVKDKLIKEVAATYEIPVKDVLYVGDSLQDIKDAKSAGCDIVSVLFSNPQWWDEVKKNNSNFATSTLELEKKIDEWQEK